MVMNFKQFGPKVASSAFVAKSADLIGRVSIDADSSVWFGAVIRADVNEVSIGKRTSIQDGSVIHVTHYKNSDKSDGFATIVGDDVTVGHRVVLHGCTIQNACLIGMGSVILDGAVIGTESIVGAGSLVTGGKVFPPRSLILGSPAKVVRPLSDDEVRSIYQSAKRYVGFKDGYLYPDGEYEPPCE